jgi:hypothetical protein
MALVNPLELIKLNILVEKKFPIFNYAQPIEALFNPNQITITKVGWQSVKEALSPVDQPATLSMDLFFDTSLPNPKLSVASSLLTPGIPLLGVPLDVRHYTRQIYHLTEKRGDLPNRPPICRLVWGSWNGILFQGVLTQVTKTFTRFRADGAPIRATLSCSFEEWMPAEEKQKIQNPIDDPIRIVRRGETLSSIAAEEYNDPTLWRVIATANRLTNPRNLTPGQRLMVPPLPNTSV